MEMRTDIARSGGWNRAQLDRNETAYLSFEESGAAKTWRVFQAIQQAALALPVVDVGRRRFWRRSSAFLASLALTAGIGNFAPAQAQRHAQGSSTPFSMAPLEPDDPLIKQLQQNSFVISANRYFGTPDWRNVLQVTSRSSNEIVYIIGYQPRVPRKAVKATFLGVTNSSKAVVEQLIATDAQKTQFAWLTPEA
ncbi:MAG: hypothetical protein IMW89_18415 [Ktedonobacteraceae bacterium]|nr:hypothetical protein [Ktedonobacteraceae bacterium]